MPVKPREFTYATVCNGIECMSAAVGPLGGWEPVFFSEIEAFPCSLLAHRYPTVPNLGDMTKITAERIGDEKWRITNGTDVIELAGRLDVLAGGTPCQDVSVAGKRAGMAEGSGTRSSLAFHFARLCRELQPRWVVWENVPGVLTSNGGRDFAHFVESIGECGYSLAYRTLDAQWVRVDGLPRAVPQRRRRVWLVGHLGDSWRAPAEVLFEPEGVRGDTAPCRVTGQGFTRPPEGRAGGADSPLPTNSNGEHVMPALTSTDLVKRMTGEADRGGGYVMQPSGFDPYEPGGVKSATDEVAGTIVNGSSPGFHNAVCFENHQAGNHKHIVAEVAPTMGASRNAQAANNNPLVVASAEVFGKTGHAIDKAGTGEKYERIEVAETRNTFANGEVRAQEVVVAPVDGVVAIDMDKNKPTNADKPVRKGGAGFGVSEKGASYTLTARDQHAVAYAIDSMGSNAMKSKNPHSGCREVECAPTLTTVDSAPVKHQGGTAVVAFLPGNSAKAQGLGAEEEVSPTLVKTQGESGNKVAVATECIGVFDREAGKSSGRADTSGVSPTILALHGSDPHAVCIGFDAQMGKMNVSPKDGISETLAVAHQCGVAIGFNAEPGTSPEDARNFLAYGREFRGESWKRIRFLRAILDDLPNPPGLADHNWDEYTSSAGDGYYLIYFGNEIRDEWTFDLPAKNNQGARPQAGERYQVEILDTWNMTVTPWPVIFETAEPGRYRIQDKEGRGVRLPDTPYLLLRIKKI